jgi:DNA-binding CsgD family transcriptional regulator
MRYVFKRFAEAFEIIIRPRQYMRLDDDSLRSLTELIEYDVGNERHEDVSIEDIRILAADVLRFGMRYQWTAIENLQFWRRLTPREKDIAACVCKGYTNQQIVQTLMISLGTVKTHVRHVLEKFEVKSKMELRRVLKEWDFSDWEYESDLAEGDAFVEDGLFQDLG